MEEVGNFDRTVSARDVPLESVGLWTEGRRGFQVRHPEIIAEVLQFWVEGKTKDATLLEVEYHHEISHARLEDSCTKLALWPEGEEHSWLKKGDKLNDLEKPECVDIWPHHHLLVNTRAQVIYSGWVSKEIGTR